MPNASSHETGSYRSAPGRSTMGSVSRPCWPSQWSDSFDSSPTERERKKSAPILRVVHSSATAFAPFSQNSATLLRPSGLGQAQLWQSNPSRLFNLRSVPSARTRPISRTLYAIISRTPFRPAAALLAAPNRGAPASTGGCAAAPRGGASPGFSDLSISSLPWRQGQGALPVKSGLRSAPAGATVPHAPRGAALAPECRPPQTSRRSATRSP